MWDKALMSLSLVFLQTSAGRMIFAKPKDADKNSIIEQAIIKIMLIIKKKAGFYISSLFSI